jgi:hypothetical protein
MLFTDKIRLLSNVEIIARERGKLRRDLHRLTHNVWVNLGREYLMQVISPADNTFSSHYSDIGGIKVMQWMGVGIGGAEQAMNIASSYPTLDSHYPGGNSFNDTSLATSYMERPVKVSGTAGVGSSSGVWMNAVGAPPDVPFVHPPSSPQYYVEFVSLFSQSDVNLGGSYSDVPLSECALMLSNQVSNRSSSDVYDYSASPYVGTHRQTLVAYNTFVPIHKTMAIDFEIHWKIQF